MSAKNDQIFQLSLTEIAFMLTFLLMLILGLMVAGLQKEKNDLVDQLQDEAALDQKQTNLISAREFLTAKLAAIGTADPEAVITKLVKDAQAQAETERLKVMLEEQDQKLTAMVELEKVLEQMSQSTEASTDHIQTSLVMMSRLGERLGPESTADERRAELDRLISAGELIADQAPKVGEGSIVDQAKAVVADARSYQELKANKLNPVELKRENANLRGQMVYLQNKLDARGGMDFPPCWADEVTGKTQLLFSLVLRDETLMVSPAWPASRNQDAAELPNIEAITSRPEVAYGPFIESVRPIFALSKQQNCRHYVLIENTIADAVQSDRKRLLIEGSFYKIEKRR